jgi:hypothetical protein
MLSNATFSKVKVLYFTLAIELLSHPAYAQSRNLESAAKALGEKGLSVARALVLFSFAVGGIMTLIPWTRHWGKEILKSSGFGALIVYGAPALIDVIKSVL